MKYFTIVLLIIGVLLFGVMFWSILEPTPPAKESTSTIGSPEKHPLGMQHAYKYASLSRALETKIHDMERKSLKLEGKMQELEQQLVGAKQEVPQSCRGADVNPSKETEDTTIKLSPTEYDQKLEQAMKENLSEVLHYQQFNREWTAEAEDSLRQILIDPKYVGTNVSDVYCGSSMCFLKLAHQGWDSFEQFRDHGLGNPLFRGNIFFSYDENTLETAVYLAREGTNLPKLTQPIQ